MKNVFAIAAIALTAAAPSFADVSDVQARFALGNDSAAERFVRSGSVGDSASAQSEIAKYNESAAERNPVVGGTFAARGDSAAAQRFFALGNDSAAERIVR